MPRDAAPADSTHLELGGLVVTFEGEQIHINGKDRWGQPLDTTYENREFLRNALPVLERSITLDQAAGLHALVDAR